MGMATTPIFATIESDSACSRRADVRSSEDPKSALMLGPSGLHRKPRDFSALSRKAVYRQRSGASQDEGRKTGEVKKRLPGEEPLALEHPSDQLQPFGLSENRCANIKTSIRAKRDDFRWQ